MFSQTCHMYEISRVQLNSPNAKWGQTIYTGVYEIVCGQSGSRMKSCICHDRLAKCHEWWRRRFDWIRHCWQWIMTVEGWPKSFYARIPSGNWTMQWVMENPCQEGHGESLNVMAGHEWQIWNLIMTMSHVAMVARISIMIKSVIMRSH